MHDNFEDRIFNNDFISYVSKKANIYEFSQLVPQLSEVNKYYLGLEVHNTIDSVKQRIGAIVNLVDTIPNPRKCENKSEYIAEINNLGDLFYDNSEKLYLLADQCDFYEINSEYRHKFFEFLNKTVSVFDPKYENRTMETWGTLNRDLLRVEEEVDNLGYRTNLGSFLWNGFQAAICFISILCLFFLPAAANFFTGRLLPFVLLIGGAILFCFLWRENGFCNGYIFLIIISFVVAIPIALVYFWKGISMAERFVFACVPAVFLYANLSTILDNVKDNIKIKKCRSSIQQKLDQMEKHVELLFAHSKIIPSPKDTVRYFESRLDRIRRVKRLFVEKTE